MKLRKTYQVNEIFNSVQGEGILVGTPATFIRLQGCTVGCKWCDTKYTWAKGGTGMKSEDIVNSVVGMHAIITGGEPTMYDLDGLIVPLHAQKKFVQLETSGQNGIKGNVAPDWITWSPKEMIDFEGAYDIKDANVAGFDVQLNRRSFGNVTIGKIRLRLPGLGIEGCGFWGSVVVGCAGGPLLITPFLQRLLGGPPNGVPCHERHS